MDKDIPNELLKKIDELNQQIKLFKSIADYSYDWEYFIDLSGEIRYVSPSCERITGFHPHDFIENKNLFESIIHENDRVHLSNHLKQELKFENISSFEFRIISKEGKERWIEHYCQPARDDEGKIIGRRVSNRDISKRKNIEIQLKKLNYESELKVGERTKELENLNSLLNEELKKSIKIEKETIKEKEFLNSLLDTAGSIVLVLDKNANILLFNIFAEKLTGYKKEEVIGKNWFELFIVKNGITKIKFVFEDVLKESPDYSSYENKILTKSGKELLINWSNAIIKNDKGEPTGVLSIGIDVTQRNELEVEYQSLYNSMNEGMALHQIVYDSKGIPIDYLLLDLNPAFERITGLKKGSVIGLKATEVYGTTEAPYLDIYSKVAITGNPTRFEITFAPMKKSFNISVFAPEKDKFATVFEDITERKKAEESLRKIEWLVTKEAKLEITNKEDAQPYGNLLELNTNRLILDSVGEDVLSAIASDYIDLLETSSAIYEENGDYAFGIFSSGWCKLLDKASRGLCDTLDNKEALESGKWHCHESCWAKASKVAIETGKPLEIECSGGINLYTIPIFVRNRVIGSINFGHGDPPKDYDKLVEISKLYQLNIEELINESNKYETRPKFIIDVAKNRLQTSAKLISEIVERKLAEIALRESEEKHRSLFETMVQGVVYEDAEGIIISANSSAEKILGLTFDQMTGRTSADPRWKSIHEDGSDFPGDTHPISISLKTGKAVNNVIMGVFNPQCEEYRWININSVPLFKKNEKRPYLVYTTFEDITERKKAEEELKESERTLQTFFAAAPVGICLMKDMVLQWANDKMVDILGYGQEELIGHNTRILFDTEEEYERLDKLLYPKTLIDNVSAESRFKRKDGTLIYCYISLSLLDPLDHSKGFITTLLDITDKKKAEEELIIYHSHLEDLVAERTTRLEIINKELEAFSYSVSHDLRAPLRAIDGFGQALLEEYGEKLGEEGKHYLKRIRNGTIKMGNLIDDMLKLSKVSRTSMKKEKVNISQITEDIINEFKKSEPNRKVKITIQKGLIVKGDSSLLKIMLENLLSNAWKFTSKKDETLIEFGIIRKEEKDIYYIKDNGVGFDMEYVDKLFTPFYRLHSEEEFSGTGIGLANVKRVINMHEGDIWAEGKVGEGATFYFII